MNTKTEADAVVEQHADYEAETDSIQLSLSDLDMVAGGTIINTFG